MLWLPAMHPWPCCWELTTSLPVGLWSVSARFAPSSMTPRANSRTCSPAHGSLSPRLCVPRQPDFAAGKPPLVRAAYRDRKAAARVRHSSFATQARDQGLTRQEIEDVAVAWEAWGAHPDAWFTIVHGEVVITLPQE